MTIPLTPHNCGTVVPNVRVPERVLMRAILAACAFGIIPVTMPHAVHAQGTSQAQAPVDAPIRRASVGVSPLVGDISVDGRLDEDVWAQAEVATDFVQGTPVEGVPAQEVTEIRVVIGDGSLYIGARMYESDPSAIVRQLVRRDQEGQYDYVSISIDPNHDQRTGYYFRVSADNVQVDQYYYDDSRLDRAWSAVWESAVHHDDEGWSAEIRIPLSQIRYESTDDVQTWGINFARKRIITNETSYFSLRSRTRPGVVSQFGTLENVRIPKASRRIEVRPYMLSGMHSGPSEDGDPFFDGSEADVRAGADFRVGLGPAFTLDATINPDFGQVDADPAVINLSAFETRFQERRPFFVEDAQIFNFTLGPGERGDQLFYSRRIGGSPHGANPSEADFSDRPDAATILGAAKLTGRTQSGLSLGVLAAVADEEFGEAFYVEDGRLDEFRVEPQTTFGVVKLQQDFNGGASQIGGLVTAMNRSLPGDGGFDFLPNRAYSAGINFQHQWNNRDWSLSGFFAGTLVQGDSTAITRIQRSSNHYFQRPDATRLGVDSTATDLTGVNWRLTLSRQNGRHWSWSTWIAESTPGFEVNDVGFSRGSEKLDAGLFVSYREITPSSWYKNYSVTLWSFANWIHEALDDAGSWSSWEGARTAGTANLSIRGTLLNEWGGNLTLSLSPDHSNVGNTRGGPAMLDPGSWNVRASINTDRRKPLNFKVGFSLREGFRNSIDDFSLNTTVAVRPSSSFSLSLTPSFSWQTTADQYVTSTSTLPYEPTFGRRYIFSDLERRTFAMQARVDWTFSPSLSFQLWAQPLVSSADYLSYKQLEASRTFDFDTFEEGTASRNGADVICTGGRICAEAFDDFTMQHIDFDGDGVADYSLVDRDFNFRSLVGNAVLRWEYRPGSTVFFVWQRRQSGSSLTGDFDFRRDFDALFGIPADNRFMVKVNYWLGM